MRKLFCLVLAVVMVASLFAAFAEGTETKYDLQGMTVKVRLWDSPNPYKEDTDQVDKDKWLPIFEGVKEKYNCEFEFYEPTVEYDDFTKEWLQSIASGSPAWHVTNNFSAMWLIAMTANDGLVDISKALETIEMPQIFKETAAVGDGVYGFVTGYQGTEGLVYNRAMIQEAGMEYTPTEMFMQAKWSYNDFYDYMVELQSKLPEGTYAFFIDPNYWNIFASAANGTAAVSNDLELTMTSEPYIETMEFLQKLWNAGVCRMPNQTESGSYDNWGTPAATFDKGVEVAMTHRAGWQMGTLNSNGLDWGFVPYPWGSGATLGEEGNYKSLENYYGAYYDTGYTGSVLKGVEVDFPGLDAEYVTKALVNLMYDLLCDEDQKADIKAKADPDYMPEPEGQFADELSGELHAWLKLRTRYNPIAAINSAGLGMSYGGEVSLYGLTRKPFDDGTAIRSTFEAAVPEIEASFRDAGYIE